MSQQKLPKSSGKNLRTAAKFSGIALQMGLTIYLGNLLGTWLDAAYVKTFWETTCTLAAIFLSVYLVIHQAIKLSK